MQDNGMGPLKFIRARGDVQRSPDTDDAAHRMALGEAALPELLQGNHKDLVAHCEKLRQRG
jgi:hypothetical protein